MFESIAGQKEGNHFIVYLGPRRREKLVCLDAPQGPKIMSKIVVQCEMDRKRAEFFAKSSDEASQLRSRLNAPYWEDARLWSTSGALC